jgi:hypothetical protein
MTSENRVFLLEFVIFVKNYTVKPVTTADVIFKINYSKVNVKVLQTATL